MKAGAVIYRGPLGTLVYRGGGYTWVGACALTSIRVDSTDLQKLHDSLEEELERNPAPDSPGPTEFKQR